MYFKFFNILLDIAFKRQVLCQLNIINLKQSQICEDLPIILKKIGMQEDRILIRDDENSIFKKFDFPLKNISELNAIEEYLMDENNTNMLVNRIYIKIYNIFINIFINILFYFNR